MISEKLTIFTPDDAQNGLSSFFHSFLITFYDWRESLSDSHFHLYVLTVRRKVAKDGAFHKRPQTYLEDLKDIDSGEQSVDSLPQTDLFASFWLMFVNIL